MAKDSMHPEPHPSSSLPEGAFSSRLFWAIALVIVGFNIGLYGAGFGISVGVFQLFTTLALLVALPRHKQTPLAWALGVVSAGAGLLVGYRANSFVQGFDLVVSSFALFFLLLLHALPTVPRTIWELISAGVEYTAAGLFSGFRLLDIMGSLGKQEEGKARWFNPVAMLKTAFITFAILGIFIVLLTSADPIFSKMVEDILRQLAGRVTWSLVLAGATTSALLISLRKRENVSPELRFLSAQDVLVPVMALAGLFGVFLFLQGKYLFASHDVFKTFGLTYSQYVRKGFTELLVATFIGSIISYLLIVKKRVLGKPYLTWLNVALLVELGLLLASAWRRDFMYIEVYGLTRTRIIGEVFLYWLVGDLLLLLLLNSTKAFREHHFLLGIGAATIGVFAYLNVVNMDMRIAQTAPKRYEAQDLFYLANLSEDSAASWEGIVGQAETRINELINKDSRTWTDDDRAQMANIKLALFSLVAQRERLEKKFGSWDQVKKTYLDEPKEKNYERAAVYAENLSESERKQLARWLEENRKWQAYTWSEMEAYKLLSQKRDLFFGKVDTLLTTIVRYQRSRNLDLYKEERWILYDYEYPFVNLKIHYRPQYSEFLTPTPTPTPTGRPLNEPGV